MSIRQCSSSNSFRKNLNHLSCVLTYLEYVCIFIVNIVHVFFHTPEVCRCNLDKLYHHYCKLIVNSVSSVRYQT